MWKIHKDTMHIRHPDAGFTLIEMIVAVAIIVIVTGFSIASFIRFNDRQQVQTAARELQLQLRAAQTKARVRETPTGCSTLERFRVSRSGSVLTTSAVCINGGSTQVVPVNTWTIPSGITITPATFSVEYKTLHGGATTTPDSPLVLRVAGYDSYEFEISRGGDIGTGGFVDE